VWQRLLYPQLLWDRVEYEGQPTTLRQQILRRAGSAPHAGAAPSAPGLVYQGPDALDTFFQVLATRMAKDGQAVPPQPITPAFERETAHGEAGSGEAVEKPAAEAGSGEAAEKPVE
jgi:hypothetical protein